MSRSKEQNDFYNTSEWRRLRLYILEKNNYICEKCHGLATIVHHIEWITEANLHDPEVTLNESNLMAVCHECHNTIHHNLGTVADGLMFTEDGDLIPIK